METTERERGRGRALRTVAFGLLAALLLGGAVARWLRLPNQLLPVVAGVLLWDLLLLPSLLRERWRTARVASPGGRLGGGLKLWLVGVFLAAFLAPPLLVFGRTMELLPAVVAACALLVPVSLEGGRALRAAGDRDARARQHRAIVGGLVALGLLVASTPLLLQLPDRSYAPRLARPAYPRDRGPVVHLDEGHHNFHTLDGGYWGFGELLRQDGYRPRPLVGAFTPASLAAVRILAVVGALHERNVEDWSLPTPSAFARSEIEAVRAWVEAGGALFLVVEHLPFAGAAQELARAFGFEVPNAFTLKRSAAGGFDARFVDRFAREDGTLPDSPVANGRTLDERVEHVAGFTGVGFDPPAAAAKVLVLGPGHDHIFPRASWELDGAPRKPADGACQGAILKVGKGRVAVFGEAAMFTTQLIAGLSFLPYGMSSPEAPENHRFVLNLMAWLAHDRGVVAEP
jgi:hypothetical protein